MTDKDKEIIKVLECVVSGRNCEKCSLQCKAVVTDDILALIYRLKTENENYSHNIKKLAEENMKLKSKVTRLKAYDLERDIALHSRLIATSRAEGIKEFAEKLISRAHYICVGNRVGSRHNLVDTQTIVDTYKEMVGK